MSPIARRLRESGSIRPAHASDELEGHVSYVGPRYGSEKKNLLAGADLLVFPAFSEAFPLVVLEAMSFALPVVSTNQGGIPDMVEEGVTGFLVPPGDERLLTDRLERLIRDPDLRKAMGHAGRQRFLERFTREKFDEKFCSILESIVPSVDEPIDSRPVVATTRGPV